MKLLFVIHEVGKVPSGVITVVSELCKGWPSADHVTLLMNSAHWANSYLSSQFNDKVNISCYCVPFFLMSDRIDIFITRIPYFSIKLILRIILAPFLILQRGALFIWLLIWMKNNKINGVLSHNGGWPGGGLNRFVIYAAKLIPSIARVMVIHNMPAIPKNFISKLFFRVACYMIRFSATKIVTVSKACRATLAVEFDESIDVIYNGISNGKEINEGPCLSSNFGLNMTYPTIGFVGELHPRKGVHIIFEALLKVNTKCNFLLVGNGASEYTDTLKKMAKNSEHPTFFLGYREDVSNLYSLMDILVLPSVAFESFGMVILEAMSHRVPVICSDFSGMKEVVVNEETGLIVSAGNSIELSIAINRLLENPVLRKNMGISGLKRMQSEFSLNQMILSYLKIFKFSK
jgi:glycosyltransferase involved in cell wall biosynthesis